MTTPQALVEAALDQASLPCVAVATERTEANLRWASNALTTNGEMRSLTLTVTVTAPVEGGTAAGTVSRELVDVSEVAALIAAAERIARSSPAAEDAAEPVAGQPGDPDWSAEPETTRIEELTAVATDLGRAFARAEEAGELLFGFAELVVTTDYLGSSTGLRRRGVQRSGRFEFNGKAADGSASAWVGQPSRDFTDIDVTALHAQLTTRLGWARQRIDLPPGRYETLLPPGAVADLMIYLYWTAGARDAEEGRNVFSAGEGRTRIGERLSPLPLRLWSDPAHPGLETVPFVTSPSGEDGPAMTFDLGLPVAATDWIADGVLRDLARNRAQAARSGLAPTPPPDNLLMDAGGTKTLEQMVAETERGLLLTCLWYIREVDPERLLLTGLTRDGVYLIENGQVVGAVNNFRFNESPVELLGRISETSAAEITLCREWNDFFSRTSMPAIRVPDFNMSTVSQAS